MRRHRFSQKMSELLLMRVSYIVVVIIFASSTLILLARADFLDVFLREYRREVAIPLAVETECVASPSRPDAMLIRERIRERQIVVDEVREMAVVHRLIEDFRLGHGEAAALALASEKHAHVVATDDRNAIRACKLLRLRFITAVGILVDGTEAGWIPADEARRYFERLALYGRYHRMILDDARRRLEGQSHGKGPEDPEYPHRRG